jgi:hypothetical protein
MVQAGMAFRRFAPGALAGGGMVLGSQLIGNTIGGDAGKQVSAVGAMAGGAITGASTGAMIGSVIAPGVGTAVGAVIGGIIGSVAPLMDKGVREAVGKLIANIGISFNNTVESFSRGTHEIWSKAKDFMGSAVKFFVNGLVGMLNGILTATQIIPRMIMGMVEGIYQNTPALKLIPGLGDSIGAARSVTNFQVPYMFAGKDYAGPAMALEARMSGRRPMVVNDGEFVIPRDGFPTLAGLVGDNLRSTGAMNHGTSQPIQVNVTLAITTHSVVADPNELANALRDPVYKIIGEAWNEAYNSTRIHRAKVS